MKNIFPKLLTILILIGCSKAPIPDVNTTPPKRIWKDTIPMFNMDGQSNLSGRVQYGEYVWKDLPARRFIIKGDTTFFNSPQLPGWEIMNMGRIGDVWGKVGIQPHIARWYSRDFNKNLYIYQTAKGAQAISEFITPGRKNGLYEHMWKLKNVIDSFNKLDIYVDIKSYTYYQGESDGGKDTAYYYKSLVKLKSIKDSIIGKNVPFILVQMSDCQTKTPYLAKLQDVQRRFAEDYHIKLVRSVVGCKTIDGAHLDYSGIANQADSIYFKTFQQ